MTKTRRVPLEAPYEGNWIEVNVGIKMRTFLELQEKVLAAIEFRTFDAIRDCLEVAAPLIVGTDLVDVESGDSPTFSFAELEMDQIRVVLSALVDVFVTGGGSADPLPSTPNEPDSSPAISSPGSPSPSSSESGNSPAAAPATTKRGSKHPSIK